MSVEKTNTGSTGQIEFKAKRIGLIQTRGIGDIIIAIPIADFFIEQGYEVFWPIDEQVLEPFQEAKPKINFIGIKMEEGALYKIPMSILQQHDCERIISLYSYLTHDDINDKTLYRSLKFDEYKYAIAGVPFSKKWDLKICRNQDRELALYNKLGIDRPYICIHQEGSGCKADIKVPKAMSNNYQIVEVGKITDNPFDWIYTFEKAAKLIFIDSCFSNLVEQLNLTNEKYLILRSEVPFTPVFKNGWTYIRGN